MLDQFFHKPPDKIGRQWNFIGGSQNVGIGQQWVKPKWATMVNILMVGAGGGGGGGYSRTAGTAGGGGGGGACGTISRLLIPATCLPEELWVYVHGGGQGAAAGGTGGSGQYSTVAFGRTQLVPNWLIYSSGSYAVGGSPGTSGTAGSGGGAPSGAAIQPWAVLGHHFTTNGIAGGNGGAASGAVGTTITAWAAMPISPGAGGAGCTTTDFAGGAQTPTALIDFGSQSYYPNSAGSIASGGAAAGGHGGSGVLSLSPFVNAGGAGGGSNNTGTAGDGGSGGYGCGGGGGGAGTTGGRGGNGGPGIVIISAW